MVKSKLILIAALLLFSVGCGVFDDAKKLKEQIDYYKNQISNIQAKYGKEISELKSKLKLANDEIKKLNFDLDKAKAEIEKTRTLHKKMLE